MVEPALQAQIDGARAYASLFVPALFSQWAPKVASAAQRVLVPGGRLAIAVWDSIERIPAYEEEAALFQDIAGVSAADAVRVPFALGDTAVLAELCAASGVAAPQIATGEGTARFPSIRVMIEADLRGWLPVMGSTSPRINAAPSFARQSTSSASTRQLMDR